MITVKPWRRHSSRCPSSSPIFIIALYRSHADGWQAVACSAEACRMNTCSRIRHLCTALTNDDEYLANLIGSDGATLRRLFSSAVMSSGTLPACTKV
jgi:hypothetical protein